jgi:hypothetical protein
MVKKRIVLECRCVHDLARLEVELEAERERWARTTPRKVSRQRLSPTRASEAAGGRLEP